VNDFAAPPGRRNETAGTGIVAECGAIELSDDREITSFLCELRTLGELPVPAPTGQLAVLLGSGPQRSRTTIALRTLAHIAAIAALLIGILVGAAANSKLPGPAQEVVTGVVDNLTPFHLDQPAPSRPAPVPTSTPPPGSGPPRPRTGPPATAPTTDSQSSEAPGRSDNRSNSENDPIPARTQQPSGNEPTGGADDGGSSTGSGERDGNGGRGSSSGDDSGSHDGSDDTQHAGGDSHGGSDDGQDSGTSGSHGSGDD
jgi:hypothetical protein